VLVAGGTGRLGTLLVPRLVSRGIDVRVLTRDRQRAAHLLHPRVEVVVGDVRNRSDTVRAAVGVEVLVSAVHGFAGPGGVSPASVDRDGNANLIESARATGAHVVLISGVGASPDSPMELFRMKDAAEALLSASGVPGTIVRPTAFLELWIDLLRDSAGRSGRPLVFGKGDNPINFVSVRDVAALVDQVVSDSAARGQTLQIGGPDQLTLNDLARLVTADNQNPQPPRHLPPPALRAVAGALGRLRPAMARQARAALVMDRDDMTFHDQTVRSRYPNLPSTSVSHLLT
jgi:NADH dehydrogenase